MRTIKSLSVLSLTVLMLAACGSSGIGDILGNGGSNQTYEIRGTVDSVDVNSRSVYLTNVSGYSNMLSSGSGSAVRVYYNDNTPVEYQGRNYTPGNLERGDQVAVRVDESGNQLVAESMTVLYNSSSGTNNGGVYGSSLTGTVRYIDTARRTIEIDRGNGSLATISYDTSTPVYYGSQSYAVSNLERGDQIDIRLRSTGNGYSAESITVIRSISNNNGSSTYGRTLRGTVAAVDTYARTITLDSVSYMSGFTGNGTSGNRVVVQYGTNAGVEVQGQVYPVNGLERGDVVEVQVDTTNSQYFANRIVLVYDSSR
jgi:hypothetical protein